MGARFKSFSIFVLLTLAVTSLFIPQASASTVPVQLYGPEQFTRDPGSPQTVSRDFSVQRLVAQSYTMPVQNGSMEGDSQVSSAVVTLNGNVILKQNDFNQNVYYLEKPVVVLSTNTFEIKLNSMPTSYITVTIVGNHLSVDEGFDQDLAVDAAGNLYILHSEWTNRWMIRMVTPSGYISTIAGGSLDGPLGGDGGLATEARMDNSNIDMTVSGSGDIYLSSYWDHTVSKVPHTSDFFGAITTGELGFAEEGGIGYIFSESGLHRSTVDLNSGVELLNFAYDADNRLVSITDRFGNDTTIQRDASGVPTSITSPDGIITSLTIDADNNLRQVTYPDSSFYAMDYTPGGLMTDEYHPDGSGSPAYSTLTGG